MVKYILLGGAMMIAGPAIAQDRGTTVQMPPSATATPGAPTPDAAVAGDTAPNAQRGPGAPASTAKAQPAGGDQVASIVESEFGTYDKDASGSLSKAEFATWMDALKAKAPGGALKPADPKWNDAAFAQADADKSASLTKQELTGFLGGAASAG
jgi:hypothetical protein